MWHDVILSIFGSLLEDPVMGFLPLRSKYTSSFLYSSLYLQEILNSREQQAAFINSPKSTLKEMEESLLRRC